MRYLKYRLSEHRCHVHRWDRRPRGLEADPNRVGGSRRRIAALVIAPPLEAGRSPAPNQSGNAMRYNSLKNNKFVVIAFFWDFCGAIRSLLCSNMALIEDH